VSVLPIRLYPDAVLRVKCPEVTTFDEELAKLARDMVQTMYAAPGVGLAAPQVGVEKRLAVVDISVGEEKDGLHILVNPRIVEQLGTESDYEGCLSIPELSEKVVRPMNVTVEARDLEGAPFRLEAEDFLGRAICHEIDHLDGVLFVDHLRGLKKDKARRHLRRLRHEAEVTA